MARGWASAKSKKNEQPGDRRTVFASPPDPNRCFVVFSKVCPNATTLAVGLESLLRQVQKQNGQRRYRMTYDEEACRLDIEFEPEGGDASECKACKTS